MAARKIRYATGIQYAEGSLTLPGGPSREVWKDSADNPMSPSFEPLEARSERGKARWWANYNRRRKSEMVAGVFD